jgi:CBS domain-containing protein
MTPYDTLLIHAIDRGGERQLAVACPQRVGPTPIATCVSCELCGGLDVDPKTGFSGVRCDVASATTPGTQPTLRAAGQTPVSAIMTEHVVSVSADAALENVRWLMLERGIGAVPVLDGDGRPVGIVSKSDLLRDGAELELDARPRDAAGDGEAPLRDLTGLSARDVMTPVLYVVPQRAPIGAVAAEMIERRVHHLLVVGEGGALTGIVSALDFVRWLAASARFD